MAKKKVPISVRYIGKQPQNLWNTRSYSLTLNGIIADIKDRIKGNGNVFNDKVLQEVVAERIKNTEFYLIGLEKVVEYLHETALKSGQLSERKRQNAIDNIRPEIVQYTREIQFFKTLTTKDFEVKIQNQDAYLYTIEIPDATGKNYLEENKDYSKEEVTAIAEKIKQQINEETNEREKDIIERVYISLINSVEVIPYLKGYNIYNTIIKAVKGKTLKANEFTAKLLYKIGYKGIHYFGYRDGECYVIFNEKDAKIVDKVHFFKTSKGECYGFTVGGKIYIDTSIAKADTPIHEYTHLWARALRENNPKEWKNIVSLMKKQTYLWNYVKNLYPELTNEDAIADEVLAHFSGKRGLERLQAEENRIRQDRSIKITDKARALQAIKNIKEALERFWRGVADFLHIHFTTAEEVADKVLADLLNGANPNEYLKYKGKNNRLQTESKYTQEEQNIIDRAKANGTYMQTPNGKQTNLTEKQWVQVRTKAFKEWFGDWEKEPENASKVVDENGEPKVVYHGTTSYDENRTWDDKTKTYNTEHLPFNVFRREVGGEQNKGFFFNSNQDNAYGYGYNTYDVYLNIRKPLVIDCNNSGYDVVTFEGKTMDTYEWSEYAERKGYDGVVFANIRDGVDYGAMSQTTTDYVVFKSNQIKSATDNVGTFDKNNNDIRFQKTNDKAQDIDKVNTQFNDKLKEFDKGEIKSNEIFDLGMPSRILLACGLPNAKITMTQSVLKKHLIKHSLKIDNIKDLVKAIQNPIMVYEWGTKAKNSVIITSLQRGDQRITVSIRLTKNGQDLQINEISSIHGKSIERLINDFNTTNSDFAKDNLKYINKEQVLNWFAMEAPLASSQTNQGLVSIAKIVKDFENPQIKSEKNANKNAKSQNKSELEISKKETEQAERRKNFVDLENKAIELEQDVAKKLHEAQQNVVDRLIKNISYYCPIKVVV